MSRGRRPEHYTIVGQHLLAEVLGDTATPAVADAWGEVYGLSAAQLVPAGARLHARAGVDPALPCCASHPGDRPRRLPRARARRRRPRSERRGRQYVTLFVDLPEGDRQPRQSPTPRPPSAPG